MAGLAALVAGLAGSVQGAAVGGGAIPGDVTKLATGIALHGLGLAIAGKVVGATALVASSRARAVGKTTAAVAANEAATAHGSTTAHAGVAGVGAGTLNRTYQHMSPGIICIMGVGTYSQVAGLAAVVAAAAGSSAAQAEGRAIGLDMAQSLAVVALLSLGRAGKRAAVGFVSCGEIWLEPVMSVVGMTSWYIPGCLPIEEQISQVL